MCGETYRQIQKESCWVSWQFELLLWGISSGFPLANYFGLPGSESIFGISQDPPCVRTLRSLVAKMDPTSVWVEPPLTLLPLTSAGSLLCACVLGEVFWLQKWEVCGRGRAQPSPLIVLLFSSEFRYAESTLAEGMGVGWGGPLPPASVFVNNFDHPLRKHCRGGWGGWDVYFLLYLDRNKKEESPQGAIQ